MHETGWAVDGYKDFTFGLSPEQVKAKCPVALKPDEKEVATLGPGYSALSAEAFAFNGSNHRVVFGFKNDKLYMVAFYLENDQEFAALLPALKEKYGAPLLTPTPEQFFVNMNAVIAGQPGQAVAYFDKGTVFLMARGDGASKLFLLNYMDQKAVAPAKKDDL
jgi:hypothetical protein